MLKRVQHDKISKVFEGRQAQAHGQIMPVKILALDQVDLPLPMPTLQLLLAGDGALHVTEKFVTDEAVNSVAAGESLNSAVAMLPEPADEVASNANIDRAIGLAGEDIDAGQALLSHEPEIAARWMLKQVQHDENV